MTTQVSTLANGLRVATDRIDTVDTVSLGIWVDVGTRHEPADHSFGTSHQLPPLCAIVAMGKLP
jgi:predicted Zn-dependent peptidase